MTVDLNALDKAAKEAQATGVIITKPSGGGTRWWAFPDGSTVVRSFTGEPPRLDVHYAVRGGNSNCQAYRFAQKDYTAADSAAATVATMLAKRLAPQEETTP